MSPSVEATSLINNRARVITLVLFIGMAALTVLHGYLALTLGQWQIGLAAAVLGLLTFQAGYYYFSVLPRAPQGQARLELLLAGFILTAVINAALMAGLGLAIGLSVLLFSLIITTLISPSLRWTTWAMVGSVSGGICASLFDVLGPYLPYPQAQVPQLNLPLQLTAGLMIVIYSGFVASHFRKYTLPHKLIVTLLTLTLIAVGILTLFNTLVLTTQLTQNVGRNLKAEAETQGQALGLQLVQQVDLLKAFSANHALQTEIEAANAAYSGDPAQIEAQLLAKDERWVMASDADAFIQAHLTSTAALDMQAYQQEFPYNVEVFATDQYGGLVAATVRTTDYYQGDEDWWQTAYQAGQGAPFISQPEYDANTHTYSLKIVIPVYAQNTAKLIGLLRTTYDIRAMLNLLNSSQSETELILPGATADQFRLIVLENGEFKDRIIQDAPFLANLPALAQQPYVTFAFAEVPSIVSQAKVTSAQSKFVSALNWQVVVHQATAASLAGVNQQTRYTILLALGIFAMASVLALGLAHLLTRPILRLADTARQVAAGDLSVQAAVNTPDEIGLLAATFNQMTAQLQHTLEGLELRVSERTRALETSMQISRRLSTLLDQGRIVREVVELLRSAYNYYHVHIYLWDAGHDYLLMVGGTGEAGKTMLARGHKIPRGRGLVGRAADTNAIVLVSDVTQAVGWLPNPLLPETRSEVAVPLALGEEVLGVLDVQQNVVSGLQMVDAELIQSIANQTAIALQNARSYMQTQQQAEREMRISAISQQILGAATTQNAMQIAIRELGRVLGVQQVTVRLTPPADPDENAEAGRSQQA